jgi:hypothetical protein
MSQFVFLYRGWAAPESAQEMQQQVKQWMDWFKELADQGHLKDRGHPLERTGRIVKDKGRSVTDGPYAEAKDFIGGYTLIEASDIDQAVKLSLGCPNFETGGFVEVRAVLSP